MTELSSTFLGGVTHIKTHFGGMPSPAPLRSLLAGALGTAWGSCNFCDRDVPD